MMFRGTGTRIQPRGPTLEGPRQGSTPFGRPGPLCLIPLLLTLFLLLSQPAWAGDPAPPGGKGLSALLDRESAEVGGVVVLTLSYSLPDGAIVSKEAEVGGLEGLSVLDRTTEPGLIRIRLLVDRLGTWKSGPITLAYSDPEGRTANLNADPVSLEVLSNLGDKPAEAELKPLQDILPTRPTWLKILPWALGAVALLAIAGGLYWWLRKRRGRGLFTEAEDPPHIRARGELQGLEARGLFERGEIKAFYFLFSEILRRYLEALRHFPAPDLTTEEIARHLHRDEDRALLALLRRADLVKFADAVPLPAAKEEDMRAALSYIDETSPFREVSPEAGGGQRGVTP